jgi:hypothetical protein
VSDRKIVRPVEADFMEQIKDNLPSDTVLFANIAKGYAMAEVLKRVSRPSKK